MVEIDKKDRKILMKIVGNPKTTQEGVYKAIEIFHKTGSIEYAQNKLKELSKRAHGCLDVLKESESKNYLAGLADYSVTRPY